MNESRSAPTSTEPLPEHVQKNRAHWDDMAKTYVASGERHWADPNPTWGIWGVPEADVRMFPDDLANQDAIDRARRGT